MRSVLMLASMLSLVAPILAAQDDPVDIKSGFVTTGDGIQLHYLEAGSGAAIVFVPGWTGAAEFWEPQIRYFSRSHRVVALDPRSQGDSTKTSEGNYTERRAEDIKELIDHLGLAPAVVVGWSRAVSEVVSLVDQFGTAPLRAVVFVDGAVGEEPTPESIRQAATAMKEMQLNRRQYTDQQARTMFHKPHSEEFYQKIIAANLKTPTNTAVVLQLEMLQLDYRAALRKLDRPVMFVGQGEGPGKQAEIVKAEVPTARIELFTDSGHALFLDDPERFNAVLEYFLNSTVPH